MSVVTENPKSVGALVAILPLIGAILYIDDRYAHASDLSSFTLEQKQHVEKTFKSFRRQELEDKIFVLDFKEQQNTATVLDKTMKLRYQGQLERLQ